MRKVLFILTIIFSIPHTYSKAEIANYKYEGKSIIMTSDVDLSHGSITLEKGSVIDLRGGSFRNGTIVCEDLTIIGNGNTVSDFPFIRSNGNIYISDIVFTGFKTPGVFIEYSTSDCKRPRIKITDVSFDGSCVIERFLRSYMNKDIIEAVIQIDNSSFTNISEFVVQFTSNCTGSITNSKFQKIGNSNRSHVSALWLGYQDIYQANGMTISGNVIEDILAPYNNVDDAREAHGIIVYGNKNTIKNNTIRNIYSNVGVFGDPGMDSEGIYLKGSNNEISYNEIINATGCGSDGAITVKHIDNALSSRKNTIHHNHISDKFSVGIVVYTNKSKVFNNIIELGEQSECGIETYCGNNIKIYNNTISGTVAGQNIKTFSGGIVVSKCKEVSIYNNTISNVPTLLNILNNTGELKVRDNVMEIEDNCVFGTNSKYTAGIVFQGDFDNIDISCNKFFGKGTRGSQVIEFLGCEKLKGMKFCDNEIQFADSPVQETYIKYLIREAPTTNITVSDNKISMRGSYISSTKGKSFKKNIMEKSNLKDSPF